MVVASAGAHVKTQLQKQNSWILHRSPIVDSRECRQILMGEYRIMPKISIKSWPNLLPADFEEHSIFQRPKIGLSTNFLRTIAKVFQ